MREVGFILELTAEVKLMAIDDSSPPDFVRHSPFSLAIEIQRRAAGVRMICQNGELFVPPRRDNVKDRYLYTWVKV